MRVLHRLFLDDRHATFVAVVSTRAFSLLMLEYFYSLYFSAAIDAGHQDVWTGGLVLINLFADALSLALRICLTFDWGVVT